MSTDGQIIERVEGIAKNARATWFALFAILAFVSIVLGSHTDADFFTHGQLTTLPAIDVSVPVFSFFFITPIILAGFYIYLHLYLLPLWTELSTAPAKIAGRPLSDRVYPWLLIQGVIWLRAKLRDDGSSSNHSLGWLTAAISLSLTWLSTCIVLAALWVMSFPQHSLALSSVSGIALGVSLYVGCSTLYFMYCHLKWNVVDANEKRAIRILRPFILPLLLLVSVFLSAVFSTGGLGSTIFIGDRRTNFDDWLKEYEQRFRVEKNYGTAKPMSPESLRVFWQSVYTEWRKDTSNAIPKPLVFADVREAELVELPEEWPHYSSWINERLRALATENEDTVISSREITAAQQSKFWATSREVWLRTLPRVNGPRLVAADLRGARAHKALLTSADLRGADLSSANLTEADLVNANLNCWVADVEKLVNQSEVLCSKLFGAKLNYSNLQGARLIEAQLQGASLLFAYLQGSDLEGARLEVADLRNAEFQGSIMLSAQLQGSVLWGAKLNGAELKRVDATGADFQSAQLVGADLSEAIFKGSLLWEADLSGANLENAQFTGAECATTVFHGSRAHGANLDCNNLQQSSLKGVIGDRNTILPKGNAPDTGRPFFVWSCWEENDFWLVDMEDASIDQSDFSMASSFKCSDDNPRFQIFSQN